MIHRVAMVMSSVGRGLIPPRVDKSHIHLKWDDFRKTLNSKMFVVNGGKPLYLAFNPSSFVLSFMTADGVTAGETDTEDFTARELLEWCENWLYDEEGFKGVIDPIHIASDDVWQTVIRRPHDEFLFIWLALRTQANRVLETIVATTGHNQQVSFSPENLETSVHLPIKHKYGVESHAVEIGLAMADTVAENPYYFVRYMGANKPAAPKYIDEGKHVRWHIGDWNGAVYQIFDVLQFPSTSEIIAFAERYYSLLNRHALIDG